jgi:hypothetical protein
VNQDRSRTGTRNCRGNEDFFGENEVFWGGNWIGVADRHEGRPIPKVTLGPAPLLPSLSWKFVD